jgi:four helix bundle protein
MKNSNVIIDKSYAFALKIVKLCFSIQKEKREFVLSRQLLKSGTSIGANVEEAVGGISKADFLAKMQIAYKEARESQYWLRLLRDSSLLQKQTSSELITDCTEILRILSAILKTGKNSK